MRHSYKLPHKFCELVEVTRGILRGTLGVLRHLVPSSRRKDAVLCVKSQPLQYLWRSGDYDVEDLRNTSMEFRLTYEGPLKSSGHVKYKHRIRQTIHKQLAELWRQHHGLREVAKSKVSEWISDPKDATENVLEHMSRRYERCGFRFVPLVNLPFSLVCGLDILFLRRENPGDLILIGGDVDNRIKTLLDALRIPENCDEVRGAKPAEDERPFFCLLENDSLITELKITTDRLLKPLDEGHQQSEVSLIINVNIKAVRNTMLNMEIL